MNEARRVVIRKLPSGVPGLDEVLGGGIPEYSFNLIAGSPGTGKTTLAQQIMFTNATRDRPGLYFTVLGEPVIKMLRYQQQFDFFDPARVGDDLQYVNLSEEVLHESLDVTLGRITREIERVRPSIVVVDSFRAMLQPLDSSLSRELELQHFVQRLALRLTGWEATTFLIGEFGPNEARDPVFTVADGVLWLVNEVDRNATLRKLRVMKVRGQGPLPGMHTMSITAHGVEVHPRLPRPADQPDRGRRSAARLSTGITGLDAMMSGGILAGDSVLVTGPTGTGKTILATQFAVAGIQRGEAAVYVVFEEHPQAFIERASSLGFDLQALVAAGKLDIMYLRPLDLSVDETLQEVVERVQRLDAKRLVIDSLTGFEAALAHTFRQDFRESFYRLMVSLTALGVTIMSIVEIVESTDYLRFSPYNISFMTDDIVAMRYVELEGELRKVIAVIKMRGSDHSQELRAYRLTSRGLETGEAMREYRGIITGVPEPRGGPSEVERVELTTIEAIVLDVVLRLGESSVDTIVNDTGLSPEQVRGALDRLLEVAYVRSVDRDEETRYRATPKGLG